MSDSESDSSDIAAMLEKAKKIRNMPGVEHEEASDDDESDDENDVLLVTTSSRKKKMSTEQRMARFNYRKKQSERNRQKTLKTNLDSSDEESEDDQIQVVRPAPKVAAAPVPSPRRSPRKNAPNKESFVATRRSTRLQSKQSDVPVANAKRDASPQSRKSSPKKSRTNPKIDEIEISSDEEDSTEVFPESAQQLALKRARALLSAPDINTEDDEVTMYDNPVKSPLNQNLKVTLAFTVDANGETSKERKIDFTVSGNEKIFIVREKILQRLELPSDDSTICRLRCGSKTLLPGRTVGDYGLKSPVALNASIYVTRRGKTTSSQASSTEKYKATLKLVLRQGSTLTTVLYGLDQPFKELLGTYGVLEFDGRALSPTSTPKELDMESEDLIDIAS